MIPPLNFGGGASSSRSGDLMSSFGSDGGTMNINYGNGVSQGGAMPPWVWLAAMGIAGLWAWKKYQ